jgi:3-oxoacyl-[acyl-carrier-protein] synthase-1
MEKEIQSAMTLLLGDNIISALGFTTEENYRNVKQGVCGLRPFAGRYGLPEPFMASEIDDARLDDAFRNVSSGQTSVNYTKLEKASIVSVAEALKGTGINPSDGTVLFILSTTKGNVFLLDENRQAGYEREQLYLWRSAELIARFFGNGNRPAVVSNACISGAAALVAAQRELRSGRYECVIVTGADVLSEFIITGFQSFKALSQEVCKPFDANRTGLNIGEAAATVILTECGSLPGSPSGGFPAVHRTPSRQCVSHLPGSATHNKKRPLIIPQHHPAHHISAATSSLRQAPCVTMRITYPARRVRAKVPTVRFKR